MNINSRTRRVFVATTIGVVISTGMVGCAANSGGDDGDTSSKELTIAMNAGLVPVFETYVEEFQKTHEGWDIEVTPVPASTPDYIQQLTTQALAGNSADILFNADALNQTLANSDVLLDLKPLMDVDDGSLATSNFLPNFLDQYRVGEEVTGIPVSADSGLLHYNADMFNEYGVEPPTAEWTYDDMYAAAREITANSGGEIYGLTTPLGTGDAFFTVYPVLRAFGSDIYDTKSEKFVFANADGIAAWEMLYQPYLEQFGTPYNQDNTTQWFSAGQAAMTIDTTGAVSVYRAAMEGTDWNVVPSPRLDGESTTGGGSYALSISADAQNPDGALEFLRWFYSVDGGMAAAAPNGVIPATVEGVSTGAWKEQSNPIPRDFVPSAEYGATNAVLPSAIPDEVAPQVGPALREALEKVLLQGSSVEEAYTVAQAELNALLGD